MVQELVCLSEKNYQMVNVIVNSDSRYPVDKQSIRATIIGLIQGQNISGNVEIGVSIVGDRKMHEFNKKYRGIDSTTNILSFALEDPISASQLQQVPKNLGFVKGVGFIKAPDNILRLGDILISYPQVIQDASLEGVSIEEEIRYLIEHGMKHLLGIHHD